MKQKLTTRKVKVNTAAETNVKISHDSNLSVSSEAPDKFGLKLNFLLQKIYDLEVMNKSVILRKSFEKREPQNSIFIQER